jgi:hypothetical protein
MSPGDRAFEDELLDKKNRKASRKSASFDISATCQGPVIKTLRKMAKALKVSLYQLFFDGEEPPESQSLPSMCAFKCFAQASAVVCWPCMVLFLSTAYA